jgi:hypothetical protein
MSPFLGETPFWGVGGKKTMKKQSLTLQGNGNKNKLYALLIIAVLGLFLFWQTGTYEKMFPAQTTSYAQVVFNYEDGTSEVFRSDQNLPGLTITTLTGTTPIRDIVFTIYVTPTYTGTMQSYNLGGSVKLDLKEGTSPYTLKYSNTEAVKKLTSSPTTIASGQEVAVYTRTYTADQIQSWNGDWREIGYQLLWTGSVSMTITFSDGSTATETASAEVTSVIRYRTAGTFLGLSVRFGYTTNF